MVENEVLTASVVARRCGCSMRTLRTLRDSGRIPTPGRLGPWCVWQPQDLAAIQRAVQEWGFAARDAARLK